MMLKVAVVFTLLFAATLATKNIYVCGVTTTVADNFDSEPTLRGNSPANYNAISFGNFYAPSADIEGAAAIRGDVNLPNGGYSFGYERRTAGVAAIDNHLEYSLIAGGNVNWPTGALYIQGNNVPFAGAIEYAYIGGSLNTTDAGITAQSRPGQGNLNAEFDAVQAYYVKVQDVFSQLPAQITAVYQYQGMTVTCPDQSASLWVVSIDGAQLSQTTYWTKTGCSDLAQFVFNVQGSGSVLFSGAEFVHDRNLVLWNVLGSGRTIQVGAIEPKGTLLAPNNKYYQPGTGVWMGLVIVGDVQQAHQINRANCPTPPAPQAPSTCVTWETECAGLHFNLGGSADSFVQYNAISFEDFNADTGDVEGRVAAKGDVHFGCGYSVGAVLSTVNDMPDVHQAYSLIAGGDLAWCSGALFPNTLGAVIERCAVAGNYSAVQPAEIRERVDAKSNLDSVFDAAQSCYCGMSDSLANKVVNTQHTIQYTGLFISCDSNTETDYVINLSGADFSQFTYYSLDNCNFQARWTINVIGTDNVDISGDSFPAAPGGVVYNVIGSGRTVTVHDTQLSGHLLACRSTLNQPTGVIVGKVVVGNVQMSKQINIMTTCPKPVSVQVTMVAANSASAGSYAVPVLSAGSFRVGDVSNIGTITAINGNVVTLNKPLAQDVSAGQVVGRVYVDSTSGRGEIANPASASTTASSASTIGVAAFAVVAALMI